MSSRIYVWILLPVVTLLLVVLPFTKGETVFDKDLAVLYFRPNGQFFNDEKVDTPKLIHMIEVVAKKFRRILLPLRIYDIGATPSFVPSAAAMYNKQVGASSSNTVELIVTYDRDLDSVEKPLLNHTIKISSAANAIFPKTVTGFYLVNDNYRCDFLENSLPGEIAFVKKSPVDYVFGIQFKVSDISWLRKCLKDSTKTALNPINHLILKEDSYPIYVDLEMPLMFKKMNNAKSVINQAKTELGAKHFDILLYLEVDKLAIKTEAELVECTKAMNFYGQKINSPYVIYEAFDHPEALTKFGWWKLASNQSFASPSFHYVEKESVLKRTKPKGAKTKQ